MDTSELDALLLGEYLGQAIDIGRILGNSNVQFGKRIVVE